MSFLLLAQDEATEASNPILPWTNELFWGALSFGALYLLVRYVLLPPVQRVMNERAATIQADRDATDAAKAQMVSASSELDDQLAGVRAEASSIIDDARTEADGERDRLLARAEREVSAMKEIAETEISRERDEVLTALRPQVTELAVGAASKVMNRQISPESAGPVIDRALENLN